MLDAEALIVEALAVDALPAGAVEVGEIAALDHKVPNYPVDSGALVVQRLPADRADALLAGAQGAEVLAGSRGHLRKELKENAAGCKKVEERGKVRHL